MFRFRYCQIFNGAQKHIFSFNWVLFHQVIRAKKLIKKATEEKKTSESTVAAAAIFKRKTLGTKLNIL